nr:MAG TPA: PHAX RNA-binding domain [Caudoviricetes sp.]
MQGIIIYRNLILKFMRSRLIGGFFYYVKNKMEVSQWQLIY